MAHNAAHKGASSFAAISKFDVEDLVVDIFYWFDKSTKRKNELIANVPATQKLFSLEMTNNPDLNVLSIVWKIQ